MTKKLTIALDYDGTYTADPQLWNWFIQKCEGRHDIWIVTMRYERETVNLFGFPVIYTSRMAKKKFCDEKGIYFDIWIDDQPEFLFDSAIEVITDIET